jgi:hypothetical protein
MSPIYRRTQPHSANYLVELLDGLVHLIGADVLLPAAEICSTSSTVFLMAGTSLVSISPPSRAAVMVWLARADLGGGRLAPLGGRQRRIRRNLLGLSGVICVLLDVGGLCSIEEDTSAEAG